MATNTTTKVRSPNYPTISLRDAVARVQTVWDEEHKHPTDREVVAKVLGYGGLNGASMSVISALTKYGLLESAGSRNELRVSTGAVDVLAHERGESERVAAVQRAAFMPSLFSELHDRFGDTLPSDQNLRSYLVKRGFNPRTVDGVIRSYRDTLEFLAEEGAEAEVEFESELEPEIPPMHTATHPQPALNPVPTRPEASAGPDSTQPVRQFSVPVSRHMTADVVFRGGEVTPRELEALRSYLEVAKGLMTDSMPTPDDNGNSAET